MTHTRWLTTRIIYLVITIFAVITLNFIIFRLMPGDPIRILIGERLLKPEVADEVRRMFGLDRPLWEQYVMYIKNLLTGYLGYSLYWRRPVLDIILERLPITILLLGTSTTISLILGVILGIKAATKRGSKVDVGIITASLVFYAVPVFWIGMMLLLFLSVYIPLFPIGKTTSIPPPSDPFLYVLDLLWHLTLPVTALVLIEFGGFALLMRSSLLEVLTENYIVTARAKGLPERIVLYGHAFRNAVLPIVTAAALSFGYVVGGATLTETVFSIEGVGRLIFEAVIQRDYPVLQGAFFILAVSVVIANFIADILYALLDPRIRYERSR